MSTDQINTFDNCSHFYYFSYSLSLLDFCFSFLLWSYQLELRQFGTNVYLRWLRQNTTFYIEKLSVKINENK